MKQEENLIKLNPEALFKIDHTFDGWEDRSTGIVYPEGATTAM